MNNERGVQRGKDFEKIIRQAFLDVPDTVAIRLPDPTNGYLGIRNISDFMIYHYPNQYFIECKSVHSNRFPMLNVTFNQRVGMLEASKANGVIAGLIIWFVPLDKTIFVPIQVFEQYRLAGEKSINMNHDWDDRFIEIKGRKKRVFFDYDMKSFIEECQRRKLGEKSYEK